MLTLEIADRIADGTLAAGRAKGAQPLTVVVLDAGGHVVVAKRADNSGILRIEIATGKAYGALGFGLPSRVLHGRAADNPNFFNAVAMASGGRLVPNPGGVLLRDTAGRIVGAVGVSGDTADMDEVCALAGIEGCGLTGDVGRG
jgi:uncharacterized protein GlcG (DUF336 family)